MKRSASASSSPSFSLRRAWYIGGIASVVSTAVISRRSAVDCGTAVSGTNSTSHWLWGEAAQHQRELSARYTGVGYVIHHLSSVFWAFVYEHFFPSRRGEMKDAFLSAAGVATVAAATDYLLTPPRLRPGFERHLSMPSMVWSMPVLASAWRPGAICGGGATSFESFDKGEGRSMQRPSTKSAEQTASCWLTAPRPQFSRLECDIETDVCIVGAGIAGLTVAYLALQANLRVVVLDAGEIVAGESGRTTAHLSNAFDDRYCEIERIHGETAALFVADSHSRAIDIIESIATDEQIDCEFRRLDGYLFVDEGASTELLDRELRSAERAGLTGLQRVASTPGLDGTGPALRFPRQAQFHPVKYLAGLAAAIVRRGGTIHTHTRVCAVHDGSPVDIETVAGPRVRARAAVVATNTPAIDRVAMHTKQAAYRSYVVALEIAAGTLPPALYWDTLDPYHYVRVTPGPVSGTELLIVGGEDHKTGQADAGDQRLGRLEAWARMRVPAAGACVWRWSGQVLEPADGIAFIGRNPGDENVYITTGDSGNGMTHGTIAGRLIVDLLTAKANPWAELYDPARKPPLQALGEYGQENLNVAAQYADWLTAGEARDVAAIPNGSGAIVRDALHKLAVFRDDDGRLHACDATCPHLGCVVGWNALESSWDCPCHGSRFDVRGNVLCGPATRGLAPANVPGA